MKDDSLRTQLVKLLTGEQAHMRFEEAVADFPEKYYNTKPPHVSYTRGICLNTYILRKKIFSTLSLLTDTKKRNGRLITGRRKRKKQIRKNGVLLSNVLSQIQRLCKKS